MRSSAVIRDAYVGGSRTIQGCCCVWTSEHCIAATAELSTQAKEDAIGYLVCPTNSNLSYTVMHGPLSQTVPSYQIGSNHILMSCLAVQQVTSKEETSGTRTSLALVIPTSTAIIICLFFAPAKSLCDAYTYRGCQERGKQHAK